MVKGGSNILTALNFKEKVKFLCLLRGIYGYTLKKSIPLF
jgi:hypothetical protein